MRPRVSLAALLILVAVPASAQQQSEGYKFLQAIKDAKGDDVVKILEQPGSRIVDTRDFNTGETALHIVAKRGDDTYVRYLLQKGADANARDNKGNTPMLAAVNAGQDEIVATLLLVKANPNLGNASGETPLIRAVQRRDLALARDLITAGANPDQTDNVAGLSARDYAKNDARATALAKLFEATPKKDAPKVAGPKF